MLGLPPEHEYKYKKREIVAIWVKKSDLFRPTPDPEITDHEAEVDFPDLKNIFISIHQVYREWFSEQSKTNEAPWTKLGYTYDWGQRSDWQKVDPNRQENVGLSEFIIRNKAKVKIHSVTPINNYCE
ncbi:MAG TPA: hypothetical protein V6D25_25740 [Leptolyngbyaceae cyanobacterium]